MKYKIVIIITGILFLFFTGCEEKDEDVLAREDLFSLSLGLMEDQIDLFQIEGVPVRRKNKVFLKDGMFFVSNGNASKVMQYNSYGDLHFLLYNEFKNPEPIVMRTDVEEGMVVSRKAATFKLLNIGEIVVDSKHNIYIEDQVPREQRIKDENLNLILASRVSRFDRMGKRIDYFGKEGIENSLFPYITKLHITQNDELVVLCRASQGWLVYGFSHEGSLLYDALLNVETLPREKEGFMVLERIIPDHKTHRLYVVASRYIEELDPATRTRIKITKGRTVIHYYDPLKKEYDSRMITLPDEGTRTYYTPEGEQEIPAPSFEVLGVTANRRFFLFRPDEENRYELVIINEAGEILARRYMLINDRELFLKERDMNPSGIIYGFLASEAEARFVWWRGDKIQGVAEQ